MTLAEIHALLASNRGLIAETWNFFVSVHLALFGLVLLSRGYGQRRLIGILLAPAYLGFMYVNYNAQVDNYQYAKLILDYAGVLESAPGAVPVALSAVFRAGWITKYLVWIYGASATLGLSFILVGMLPQKKRELELAG